MENKLDVKYFISIGLPGGSIGRFDDIESATLAVRQALPEVKSLVASGGIVLDADTKNTLGICGLTPYEKTRWVFEHGIAACIELKSLATGQTYNCIQQVSRPGFVVGVGRYGRNKAYELPQKAREFVANRFSAVFSLPPLERGAWIEANKTGGFTV